MKVLLLSMFLLVSCASYRGEEKYTTHHDVFYTENKSVRQQGDIYIPDKDGMFPGVILVHGGGWNGRKRQDMDSIAESLASNGFVVFNINYRFAPEHQHPAPIDDLEVAIKYLKQNSQKYKLNKEKIGLWGYSSGGHTSSFYALTRAGKKELEVQAVVSGGAPYDFTWYPHSPYIKGYTGVYRDQNLKLYIEASVPTHINSYAPTFFLYHAENDRLVEWVQAQNFAAKLKYQGLYVKTYSVKFWGHAFAFALPDAPVEKGIKFLKKKLR